MNRKLRYLRDRVVNAFAMLRQGEFRSMLSAVVEEGYHRVESVRAWWHRRRQLDYSKIPDSAYVDRRKVGEGGFRPTRSVRVSEAVPELDRESVRVELEAIVESIRIPERRRR